MLAGKIDCKFDFRSKGPNETLRASNFTNQNIKIPQEGNNEKSNQIKKIQMKFSLKRFSRSASPKLKKIDSTFTKFPFWKEDDIFPLIELKIKTKRENNMNKNNCFIDDITKDKESVFSFKKIKLFEMLKKNKPNFIITNYIFEEKFVHFFFEKINFNEALKHVCLKNNNLSDESITFIVSKLPEKIEILEINHNFCGSKSCASISQNLCSKNFNYLIELSLRKNRISDSGASLIFFSVMLNRNLRKLNLCENQLTFRCAESLKNCLQSNISLYELYLSWNNFNSEAGIYIFHGLIENYILKVLDLSFNRLSKGKYKIAENIQSFLIKNETGLLHLDLSYNQFEIEDSRLISLGLEENHLIYGFHFEGNAGNIDAQGHLIVENERKNEIFLKPKSYEINGVIATQKNQENVNANINNFNDGKDIKYITPFEISSNCWICEGWQETKFKISLSHAESEVYLHLNFNNYQPLRMNKKKERFILKSMCPPNETFFFYTFKGNPIVDKNQALKKNNFPNLKKIKFGLKYIDIFVPIVNKLKVKRNSQLFDSNYNPIFDSIPRNKQNKSEPTLTFEFISKIDNWKIQSSFFFYEEFVEKNERNLKLSNQCFEIDWSNSNLSKTIREKDGKEALKIVLKNVYSNFIDCYTSFLSQTLLNDRFVFTKKILLDFCFKCGINSNKSLTIEEINLVINSIKIFGENIEFSYFSNFSFMRFEFLEFLVKIGHLKFSKKIKNENYANSFKFLLENGLFAFFNNYNCDHWRLERLWKEDCEKVLQYYFILINGLFKKYSVSKFYKNQSYMTHHEFFDLIETSQILNDPQYDSLEQNDLNLFFLKSICKQIDETSDRAFIMNFMEFFEALARVAEKISANPLKEDIEKLTFAIRKKLPLNIKLESLLEILYKNCFIEMKSEFQFPIKSIFDLNSILNKSPRAGTRNLLQKQFPLMSVDSNFSLQTNEEQNKQRDEKNLNVTKEPHNKNGINLLRNLIKKYLI